MVSLLSVSYAQWLSTRDAASLTHARIRRQRPLDERQPAHDTHGNVRSRACSAHEPSSSAGANHREPGNSVQIHRRPAARRRRVRSSVPRAAARTVPGRARDPLHQGQHAHRRLAPRGVFRAAARRASPGHSRLRRVPAAAARDTQVLYCLALEYARFGDLSAYLRRHGDGWPERTARREIAGILEVLGKLHRGQLLHRDLTPLNVFVCDGRQLKLGDFGIVQQQSDRRGITARTMNALTAPSDILAGTAPKWQARDDVYQVGQLLGMLIKGDARTRIRTPDVRLLPCSDHLKEIVYRCLGERRKRYESADELIDALRNPPTHAQRRRAADAQGRAPHLHRHPQQSLAATPSVPRAAPARSSTADRRRRPR